MSQIKSHIWNRTILGLLAVTVIGLAIAYQARAPVVIEMLPVGEEMYLERGFHRPEEVFGVTYRWTNGDAHIRLPGLGSGAPFHLTIQLHAFRPPPLTPTPITISVNGRPAARLTPTTELAAYEVDLPASLVDLRGDLVIGLKSDTFVPKQTMGTTDERALGLFIDQARLEYGLGLIVPPLIVWALLAISVLALYGLGQIIGLDWCLSLAVAGLLLAAEIIGVILARPWLAFNSPWLALTTLSLYLIALRLKNSQPLTIIPSQSAIQIPKSEILSLLAVFAIWRIALVIVPIVGSSLVSVTECCPQIDATPLTSAGQAVFERWYRWDAIWYGSIAQNGYQYAGTREASNVAFFPLFPLLSGLVSRLMGLPVPVSAPLVSTLVALLACVLLHRLMCHEMADPDAATRSVIYLLAFPGAFYLAIGYTEALYLLCGLAAFGWARQKRWGLAGIAAFLAGLTRLHGPLLTLPLAYEYMRQRNFRLRDIRADVLGVFGGPLGVLAFMGYLGLRFGQPMAYFQVQGLFFNRKMAVGGFPSSPGATLANYLRGLVTGPPSTEFMIEMIVLLLFLFLTLEAWVRLPRVYGIYMLTMTLFTLTSGTLSGLPRYSTPVFPIFMVLGLMGRHLWIDRAILIGSLLLQGVLALMFSNGYWIA